MSEIINFENVNISAGKSNILKNIYFEVEEQEFVFIFGNIGTGKTSLLKAIYAELPINSGSAQVLDYDLKRITKKQIPFLRRKIGFIFQDFKFLTDRNIAENLRFILEATGWADDKKINDKIKSALDDVGMLHKKNAMPYELSGGEQQRIALARALLNNPQLILADEPTGNLDESSTKYVTQKLYKQAKNGTTVIFVTHDKSLVKFVENYTIWTIAERSIKKI